MPAQNNKGFTLVELLVVISIIAILSVIGLTIFSGAQKSARDAKRRGDMDAIAKALEIYKSVKGAYPTQDAISCESNWDALETMLAPYIQDLPKDPQNICNWAPPGKFYKYHTANGSNFELAASLENTSAATGDFTVGCNPPCIFQKVNGGFGYHNQQ